MNAKTLKALKGSIEKWEGIVEGIEVDDGVLNCPLCFSFKKNYCSDCPVRKKVNIHNCNNTPYVDWFLYVDNNQTIGVFDQKSKQLAQAELDFLKSLLPEV